MYLTILFVIFCQVVIFTESYADICDLPNGNLGTCIEIAKCKPLLKLYNKRYKTDAEYLYISQTVCNSTTMGISMYGSVMSMDVPNSVGYKNTVMAFPGLRMQFKKKVCCPRINFYSNFKPKHVIPATRGSRNVDKDSNNKLSKVNIPKVFKNSNRPRKHRVNRHRSHKKKKMNGNKDYVSTCGFDTTIPNKNIGENVTTIDQYPWVVLLEYGRGYLTCGGSLVTARFVLTAAHCVRSRVYGPALFAHLGGSEKVTKKVISINGWYMYPLYNKDSFVHDIGIVKLSRKVVFNDFIRVICIPKINFVKEFTWRTKFTVAELGGAKGKFSSNDVKRGTVVPYVPIETCKNYRFFHMLQLNESQICAGGEENRDTCIGISGGPLMYKSNQLYFVVGIVVYGRKSCDVTGHPAFYTNVNKYVPWIRYVLYKRRHGNSYRKNYNSRNRK